MTRVVNTAAAAALALLLVPAVHSVAADAAAGKATYDKKCATCHGPDGKGNAKMDAALKAKTDLSGAAGKSDAELLKTLGEGKKPMPAFGKSLSATEMDDVLAYTKGLVGGAK